MKVALTFDAELPGRDHYSPGALDRILDVLIAAEAPATFFLQGRWCNAEPRLARAVAERFEIGNHGQHHVPMTWLAQDYFGREIADAARAIDKVVGRPPLPLFRPPFGLWEERLNGPLKAWGYDLALWTDDVADWEPATRTADVEARAEAIVAAAIARESGFVVLLLHTWPRTTAAALPRVIDRVRRLGADLVPYSEVKW